MRKSHLCMYCGNIACSFVNCCSKVLLNNNIFLLICSEIIGYSKELSVCTLNIGMRIVFLIVIDIRGVYLINLFTYAFTCQTNILNMSIQNIKHTIL